MVVGWLVMNVFTSDSQLLVRILSSGTPKHHTDFKPRNTAQLLEDREMKECARISSMKSGAFCNNVGVCMVGIVIVWVFW